MTDFNKILTLGKIEEGIINTVIEIPQGSILKIEYRPKLAAFEIDRIEPDAFPKPANYGFIPQTLDGDGDELDTLVISPEPISTGVFLQAKILGVMKFEDDGEMDYKIVCTHIDDRNNGNQIQTLDDLGKRWIEKTEFHFNHYKDLKKPGTTKVIGWGDIKEAQKIIEECSKRYKEKFKKA